MSSSARSPSCYFVEDPSTSLLKLRQFGEVLAQRTAAQAGLYTSTEENQVELLARLRKRGHLLRDAKGRVFSTPRNSNPPSIDDFNPRIRETRAGDAEREIK